jgi:AcrR family transcriptional regulator
MQQPTKDLPLEPVSSEKRRKIIDAAIRTFSRKGYHESRVSDIANEAGVAYGLVYHYFENKEQILNSIFTENWRIFLEVLRSVERDKRDLRAQFESICSFLLEAYRTQPELIEVIILEVTRSPKFMEKPNLELFGAAFDLLEKMIRRAQRKGGLRKNIDVPIACYMVLGAIETVLSGFVLHMLDLNDPKNLDRTRRTMVEMSMCGLLCEGK